MTKKILIITLLALGCNKTGTEGTTKSDQTCSYVDQTPDDFGNLQQICSIRYSEKSKSCINHLTFKPTLISRYIDLWNSHFDTLINNTSITFYQGDQPDKNILFNKKTNMTISNYIDTQNYSLGNINYKLSGVPFLYEAGQAYPNFANSHWGGGVLHDANVQEEIKMRQSNALIWIAQAANADKNYTAWCPAININNLEVNPIVMKLSIIFDFDNDKGYSGKALSLSEEDQKLLLTPKNKAEEIYSYAMAAPSMKRGSTYSKNILEDMFYVATTAFYYTMLALDRDHKAFKIHAGNWGAGAFNNNRKIAWAIQLLAIKLAYDLFEDKTKKTPSVDFYYDANSDASMNQIVGALSQVNALLKDKISANDYIDFLLTLSQTDDSWQVQK